AGSAENLIPAQAHARAALRAHRPGDRVALRRMVDEVVAGIAAANRCRRRVTLVPREPAREDDPRLGGRARARRPRARLDARRAGGCLVGGPEGRSSGSDDLAFCGALAPIAMAFVGLDEAAGFQPRPLHHPELLPPDSAVGAGARVQALLYVAATAALDGGE